MEPSLKFNNGCVMPAFGLGTWLSKPGEVGKAVRIALETGYKHIDCAHVYGNEVEIGESFAATFKDGVVKREEIFVTSKLWVKDFGNVREACQLTLKNLQLNYLDLYLIHLPFEVDKALAGVPENGVGLIGYNPERINEVWQEMEKLVDEGLVKSIGVSNFTILKLKNLLASSPKIIPANNQVELNPYLPQPRLLKYCKENGITIVAYSPLSNPGRPQDFKRAGEPYLLDDEVIKGIATKHNATVAQVLLAWCLERNTGVVAKSTNEKRIKENFCCLKIKLDDEEMKAIDSIETRWRFCGQPWAVAQDQKLEDIWDGEFLG